MKHTQRSLTPLYCLHQAAYFFAMAGISAFAVTYLMNRGFGSAQIGIMLATTNILSCILQPLIGSYVDAYFEGHTVDEAFVSNMFLEINKQCHLDEIQRGATKQLDMGALPAEAVALLVGLAICWILMGALLIRKAISTKMKKL